MSWIIFLLVVVALMVPFVLLKENTHKNSVDEIWAFYARKLLSQPEQVLYFRLAKALPDHIVLTQVQLSRFLGAKKGNNSQAWFNRINRLSADFVVCNKDFSVVAVIELGDASHETNDRRATDAKKDNALSAAGIRIIRWQAKALPDEATIKAACLDERALKQEVPQLLQLSA